MSGQQKDFIIIPLSFIIVYVVWGTTYLANAWGVHEIPPFLFAGVRFLVAGGILLAISSLFTKIRLTWVQIKNLAFAGLLLFGIGNGLLAWALQYIDSGITSLVVAFEPLLVALMLWQMRKQRPRANTWIGILLGIIGMVLLVGQPQFVSNWQWLVGTIFCLIAIFGWGYVSIWIPSADLPKSVLQSAAFQMVFGGLILLSTSVVLGNFSQMNWSAISSTAIWSWAYLILFGSILAISAFNYLLLRVSPTKVAASTYVHPVIALTIGWWLNHEHLSAQSLIAAAVLILGVVLINREKVSR